MSRIMSDEEFQALMSEAAKSNASMDDVDHRYKCATPLEAGLIEALRVADSAVECGIKIHDWSTVAEGLDLLRHIISSLAAKQGNTRDKRNGS